MSLLSGIQPLDELDVENQRVFVRADLDVPTNKAGDILDDSRLRALVPTIKRLQESSAKVIIASRVGANRKAKKSAPAPSIESVAARLSALCECDVLLPDAAVGESVKKVVADLRSSQVCVLENLASDADEGPGAEGFARQLQIHADVYVADSIRALERDSASTVSLPMLLDLKAASPRMMQELQAVSRIRAGIDPPRVLIWGGNTLSGRIDLLHRLSDDAQRVMLVGVAGNTMLRALGGSVGTSAIEDDYLAGARTLAERLGEKLVLPLDLTVATSPKSSEGHPRTATSLGTEEMALDLGPQAQKQVRELIHSAGTAIWCGTAGFYKSETFAAGTRTICQALAETEAFTMVVGDDSVAAAHAVGAQQLDSIDCVSLGGQATLALLNETKLVGLEALRGATDE